MKRQLTVLIMLLTAVTICNAGSVEYYDVTWDSPGKGSTDSMPLGNGEIGLNAWTEPNGDLVFYISRTDSWGDNSRLLKVGKLRVQIDPAPENPAKDFQQKLSLEDATIYVRYGQDIKLEVWVDANNPVIHVASESNKPIAMTASIELWRTEPHQLPSVEVSDIHLDRSRADQQHAPTIVEPDTILKNQRNRIGWYHHNKKSFGPGLTMNIQDLAGFEMVDPILHRTFGAIVTSKGAKRIDDLTLKTARAKSPRLDIHVLTKHPALPDEWLAAMDKSIEQIENTSFDDRLTAHEKWWSDFWNRSWIYATEDKTRAPLLIQPNTLPVRIGADQNGQTRFAGDIARVTVANKSLDEIAIRSIASTPPDKPAISQPLYSAVSPESEPIAGSDKWNFDEGLAVEAWIKPQKLPNPGARIIDKITPGGDDGFLLDTYPGNSLRFITKAGTITAQNVLGVNEWANVAATAGADGLSLFLNGKRIAHQSVEAGSDAFVVTRGYILQRFINACGGRGAYPIKYNGSIFTVDHGNAPGFADYRRWGPGYWWQNTRLPYISMCTSGDYDLMGALFEMYAGQVFELSKYRTRHYFDHGGAYYPECIYFWGAVFSESYGWQPATEREDKLQTSGWHKWEWVCGPELVWMMFEYYEHTQDEKFLTEKILPVAYEVIAFFDNYYDTDKKGKLVMHPSQAVETWWKCTNPMSEVAGLIAITQKLRQLPERLTTPQQRAYYKQIAAKLPAVPTRKVGDIEMLAPAEKFENKRNVENPELYAVFPFRLITFATDDTQLGIEALNHRWDKGNSGWRQDDLFMTYLGLTERARENLVARARQSHGGSRFAGFWGPNYDWVPDQTHGGVLQKALQSMLIQSDGRKIYLMPTWPKDWNVDFKLHAPYNTALVGNVRDGKLTSLKVTPAERRKDVVVIKPQ